MAYRHCEAARNEAAEAIQLPSPFGEGQGVRSGLLRFARNDDIKVNYK